jgi:hypothetical protein
VPPIEQLQRPPLIHLTRLQHQGIFTTGLLLEVSETPTRRTTLADQIGADITDVMDWRDEALLLNLASFGLEEQALFTQAGIIGLSDLLKIDVYELEGRLGRAARFLAVEPPPVLAIQGWWEQAQTLAEE